MVLQTAAYAREILDNRNAKPLQVRTTPDA